MVLVKMLLEQHKGNTVIILYVYNTTCVYYAQCVFNICT